MKNPKIVDGEPSFDHACEDCKPPLKIQLPLLLTEMEEAGWTSNAVEYVERAVQSHEALEEILISLRFWFNNGHSPSPDTLWDDGKTWKQKVQKAFEGLARAEGK